MLQNYVKKVLVLITVLQVSFSISAQENNEPIIDEYDAFYDYKHWGFSIMPVMYKGVEFSDNTAAIIEAANHIPSIQLAFRYHFNHAKAFSINTGLIFTWTPLTKYSFTLKQEDVYREEDRFYESNGFTDSYFLIPLNLEYKLRVGKNLYLNVNGGVITAIRDGGFSASGYHPVFVDFQEDSFQVFKLNYKSTDFQVSSQVSTGLYIVLDKFMLRTNLLYNKSFKDTQKGGYSFRGLRTSLGQTGSISLSGDYFGISTTIYFKHKN